MIPEPATDWGAEIPEVDPGVDSRPPTGASLAELALRQVDETKTLLGKRFLCVGGTALFVGPSGVGKSSASVQQDVVWSLGKEAFGIKPARPLRILTIQAENDDGDLTEMSRGVLNTLHLDEDSLAVLKENTHYVHEQRRVGVAMLKEVVRPLCEDFRPDLVRLDPLMGFCGCDPSDAESMAAFLRGGLNPILEEYNCAAIINHHTPKVTNRDTSKWRASDWMYSGMGSSDVTNSARAIIVIDSTRERGMFKFIAAKRGNRIGWRDANDNPEFERFFCHSRVDGEIYWREATVEEIAQNQQAAEAKKGGKTVPTPEQFMGLMPTKDDGNPRAGVLSSAQVMAHFKKNHWDKDALAGIREELEITGRIRVIVCAHNSKFMGRPDLAERYDRWRKDAGTILETEPLRERK